MLSIMKQAAWSLLKRDTHRTVVGINYYNLPLYPPAKPRHFAGNTKNTVIYL